MKVPSAPLQRLERATSRAVTSPIRPNRLGVAVPYRVLSDDGVAGALGCLVPVRSWRSLNTRSCRSSVHRPCPRKRLLGRSSPGVRPSFAASPAVSARSLSAIGHLSWGFLPLQRARRRESTSRRKPSELPGFAEVSTCESHPAGYGAALRFSQPPSGLLPPSTLLPSFRQVAFLGFLPSGVSSPHAARTAHRRPPALLTFLPLVGLTPFLGGGTSGHTRREPRTFGSCLCSSSGPSSAWESVTITGSRLASRQPTCPSWASASPWVAPHHVVEASTSIDRRA
jgi:hypothetical protein